MGRENRDLLVLLADRAARPLNKVQCPAERLDTMVQQSTAHLHIRVCTAAFLTDDIVKVDLALLITKVQPPDIRARLIARERHAQFRCRMCRPRLDKRTGEQSPTCHICVNAARGRCIRRRKLNVGQRELCARGNIHIDLLRPVFAQLHNMF